MNFYDRGLGTRPFAGIGLEYRPNIQSRAAFDFNHYDLVYDVFTLQSLSIPAPSGALLQSPISINDFRTHYDWAGGGRWAALGDASYGFISDNNKRLGAHEVVSFRILNTPFLAIKEEGHLLSYDFRSNRYWSPNDYKSLAGVVQIGQNLKSGLHWDVSGKVGKAWEGNHASDIRAYDGTVAIPVSDAFDLVGNYGYGKSGRLQGAFGSSPDEFVNYWQRHWYVGVRLKQLFSRGERGDRNPYYFDNRVLTSSPVVPPEAH